MTGMMKDNLYSIFVNWSKIMLPLAALALLSTVFLLARGGKMDTTIPLAELEAIAREPRISAPRFAGTAEDGSAIAVSAELMRPDPASPERFFIESIRATVDAPDGSRIEMTSGSGVIDGRARTVELSALVRLATSDGYMMETAGLRAQMDSGQIASLGPLEVRTPFGQLTAGRLIISTDPGGLGQQMVFNEGVRLLYHPQP